MSTSFDVPLFITENQKDLNTRGQGTSEMNDNFPLSKLWEMVTGGQGWRAAVHGVAKSWAQMSD